MKSDAKTTTADALLGLLSIKPMSGYEIKAMIQQSIGNFWSESFGQIYPALKRMEGEGLIVAEKRAATKTRDVCTSRSFKLTAAGRKRLGEWLRVTAKSQVPRNELLLKLFFGAEVPVETMRAQILAMRASYSSDLERYKFIVAQLRQTRGHLPGFPYWMMTVRYGQAEAQALLAWADESLAALNGLEPMAGMSEGQEGRNEHAS